MIHHALISFSGSAALAARRLLSLRPEASRAAIVEEPQPAKSNIPALKFAKFGDCVIPWPSLQLAIASFRDSIAYFYISKCLTRFAPVGAVPITTRPLLKDRVKSPRKISWRSECCSVAFKFVRMATKSMEANVKNTYSSKRILR